MTIAYIHSLRRASVALLVMFFVGFLSIVGISVVFQKMIDLLDERRINERARLFCLTFLNDEKTTANPNKYKNPKRN